MKKLTKFLTGIILGTMMLGATVFAADAPVIKYANATAALYARPEADANAVALNPELIEDGLAIIVKDYTTSAFYVVDVGVGIDYYIPMVSMNATKEDALAADAFDKALAETQAVLASGELNSVGVVVNTETSVNADTTTNTSTPNTTQAPQSAAPVSYNFGNEPYTGKPIAPSWITSYPHTYGTPFYNRVNKKVVNSETDPYSIYLNDDYKSIMDRLEKAHTLGYRYFITVDDLSKGRDYVRAMTDFEKKYGITWKFYNLGNTTMYIERYDNMLKTSKVDIQYAVYTW